MQNPTLLHFNTIPDPPGLGQKRHWSMLQGSLAFSLFILYDLNSIYPLIITSGTLFHTPSVANFWVTKYCFHNLIWRQFRAPGLEKPTSELYGYLIVAASPKLSSLHQKLTVAIPGLDDDDWVEIWDFPFSHLVSARDKMIQFKILDKKVVRAKCVQGGPIS